MNPVCSRCGPVPCPLVETGGRWTLWAAGRYEPPLAPAIGRLKYELRVELVPPLARLLARACVALGVPEGATLVPVPLHPRRLAERGFNQAALLGRELARSWPCAVAPLALRRDHFASPQAYAGRSERAAVRDAFSARERLLGGRPVIVLDDVVTTGATAEACVRTLQTTGAQVLGVLALARTLDR